MTLATFTDMGAIGDLKHFGIFEDELFQAALDGSGRVRRLLHTRSKIDNKTETSGYWAMPKPTVSRDGRFIAYTSNWEASGRYDLFIARVEPAPALSKPAPDSKPVPDSKPAPARPQVSRPRRVDDAPPRRLGTRQ